MPPLRSISSMNLVARERPADEGQVGRSVIHQGIVDCEFLRFLCLRTRRADITPSLIMSTTSFARDAVRKKILLAFVAVKHLWARAARIRGSPTPLTAERDAMSPGPHSAKATPGISPFLDNGRTVFLSTR